MYNPPIKLYEAVTQTLMEEKDGAILAKIQSCFDIEVDKGELVRALQYDRDQYNKGFEDGRAAGPKWYSVEEKKPEPFASVLVHMPGEAPLPTVAEGYYVPGAGWSAYGVIGGQAEVTHWAPMPQPPEV